MKKFIFFLIFLAAFLFLSRNGCGPKRPGVVCEDSLCHVYNPSSCHYRWAERGIAEVQRRHPGKKIISITPVAKWRGETEEVIVLLSDD